MKITATAQVLKKEETKLRAVPSRKPPPGQGKKSFEKRFNDFLAGGVKPGIIANMLNSLALLLKAGIPVGRAVEICAEQETHPILRQVMADIHTHIGLTGTSVSNAFARHKIFGQDLILLIRAGEVSGQLAARLEQAARLMERQIRLSNKIKEAVTSPMVTAGICLAMTYLVVRFVLPRFIGLYDGMHMSLPMYSQVVIAIVKVINDPTFTFAGLAAAVMLWANRESIMQRLMTWGLKYPYTRGMIGQLLATSFCDVVGHLYSDGVAISTALEMMSQTTKINSYRDVLNKVVVKFKSDGQLSEACKMITFFPPTVVRMLKVGEESGSIDKMLFCIGKMLDESNQELFTRLVTALEPAMMALVGGVLCFFFVGLFLPIYGLLNHLGM